MKISEIINSICELADYKFTTDHPNDVVTVNIYSSGEGWNMSLYRPTTRELDHGEISDEKLHTVKVYESLTGFYTHDSTLIGALRSLLNRVQQATEWEQ